MAETFGVIFRRTLWDNRKGIFWWGIGIGLLAFYVVVAFPLVSEFEQFNEILENPIFQALLGDVQELDITTPEGFLGIEFYTWTPLVLAVFAVLFGLKIVGAEEANGTLDILLSTPIPRWRVIVEKFLAFIVACSLILLISLVMAMVGVAITAEMDISAGKLFMGMLNTLPVLLLIGALSLFLTTVLRSRGGAGGIAAGIIAASYFINSIGGMADSKLMQALQNFSFYKYYSPFNVLTDGINWGNFAFLVAITAVLFGLSIYFFERRDLSV